MTGRMHCPLELMAHQVQHKTQLSAPACTGIFLHAVHAHVGDVQVTSSGGNGRATRPHAQDSLQEAVDVAQDG